MNFRNKRKKYKDHIEKTSKADDESGKQNDKPKTQKSLARANVEKFFKDHNIRRSENGIQVGGKVIRVSYDDVIADLTMNNKRTAPNLSEGQMNDVLAELNRMGFPVGNIRSEKIKKRYKDLREQEFRRRTLHRFTVPSPTHARRLIDTALGNMRSRSRSRQGRRQIEPEVVPRRLLPRQPETPAPSSAPPSYHSRIPVPTTSRSRSRFFPPIEPRRYIFC